MIISQNWCLNLNVIPVGILKQPHPHIAHQPPHKHHLIIRTRNKVNELTNNIYIDTWWDNK